MNNWITRLIRTIVVLIVIMSMNSGCSQEKNGATVQSCKNGLDPLSLDKDFKFPGVLLFSSQQGREFFSLDGETHEITILTDLISLPDPYQISPLSPDGKSLVISQFHTDQEKQLLVQLISYDGATEIRKTNVEGFFAGSNFIISWNPIIWINNSLLHGSIFTTEEEPSVNTLFDPFLLEWKNTTASFDIRNFAPGSGYSISPDLSKIMYVNDQYQLVLYDPIVKQVIWEYLDYDGINPDMNSTYLREATWSGNGTMLATPISNKDGATPGILILNKDGKIINFAYFGSRPFGLSWSHNQKYVSFFENRCKNLDCLENNIPVIRLYRVEDSLVHDLCLFAEENSPIANIRNQRIVWSPDDRFIAYGFWNHNSSHNGVIIQKLDDEQVRVFVVEGKDLTLLGWSAYKWENPNEKK